MFLPLLVRSAYSLFYGTRMPHQIAAQVRSMGYPALALTDRNNLYGVHEFIEACREEGVRPLIGASIQKGDQEVVFLAKNREGFSNLCSLLTRRMQEESFSLVKDLPPYTQGNAVLCKDPTLLEGWVGRVEDLSVSLTGLDRTSYQRAKRLQLPAVVAPEVLFFEKEDVEVHRVLQAIGGRKALEGFNSGQKGRSLKDGLDGFLLKAEEAVERFSVFPDAVEAAHALAERCQFQDIYQGFIFPRLPDVKKGWTGGNLEGGGCGNRTVDLRTILRTKVLEGAEERYGELADGVLDRIEYELSIIEDKGFTEYFLVVSDIVRRSSRTCGRGSAAASVVAYCLGITNVDPIHHELYFERFLNLDRQDPPDIDVDFAWDERDAIIEEVFSQYGGGRCARVCNHVFYRFPSALRDTARVFGIPEGEITAMEKRLARESGDPREAGSTRKEGRPEKGGTAMKVDGSHARSVPPPWGDILRIAHRITGLPRHLSVHSGGVVITPEPIDRYVPIEIAEKGVPIVTWEKDGVEAAGLVKIDLLGNRSLAVIRDALENLATNGIRIEDGFKDPTADPATVALLARGDTMGVFYVESPAMRQLQAKTQRGDFEHLVIHSSIIRPAANRFINQYVRRLKGEPYEPIHPDLNRILSETYGILCYQEDVSKAAVVLAGFSNADADGLRKILSKKNKQARLAQYQEQFYQGAMQRSIPLDTVRKVWEMILSFDGYSFCKAHSASYAMVSFQSAYLKAHHGAEFIGAVLSNRGGYYSPAAYISEARRMGLTVLGPDVNQSLYNYVGYDRYVRVGFVEVGGLHRETAERIFQERSRGAFKSVEDFACRVPLQGEDAEALVTVGALDSIAGGLSRVEQLWTLLRGQYDRQGKNGNTTDLLFTAGQKDGGNPCSNALPSDVPALGSAHPSPLTSMEGEFHRLGFLLNGHVLRMWEPIPRQYRQVQGKDLPLWVGKWVELVSWPVTRKEIFTREGSPMEFVSFEDESAIYEAILFPEVYKRFGRILDEPRPLIVKGTVQEDLGAVAIHVEALSPLLSRRNQRERRVCGL